MGAGVRVRDQTSRARFAHREVLALAWPAGHTPRPRMGTDAIHSSRRLALTRRHDCGRSRLTRIGDGLYTRPRMGTVAIHPNRCRALSQPTTRLPDYPTTRLPDYPTTRLPDYPTTRLPDYPTTRLPDYPTTRLPRAASRSADRAAGDRPVPVLSAAASIRVAHSRHASVRPIGRPRRPPLPPVQTSMRSDACRPPPRVACAGMPFRGGARASKEVRPRGLT